MSNIFLTNNFLLDWFVFPAIIALIGTWILSSGIFGIGKWFDSRKTNYSVHKTEKKLEKKISQIKKTEKK